MSSRTKETRGHGWAHELRGGQPRGPNPAQPRVNSHRLTASSGHPDGAETLTESLVQAFTEWRDKVIQ